MSDPSVPREGLPYHLVQRAGAPGWWRPVVGTIGLVVIMLGLVPLLVQIPFAVGYAAAGRSVSASMQRLVDLENPTPLGLAYLNLVLAAAIPVTWLLMRLVHGLRPRWLASVFPGSGGGGSPPAWVSPSSRCSPPSWSRRPSRPRRATPR
ncbi:hypothetical protein [Nocardioides ungokensis]|uniref:hypothetical protein n=1 Tax=Nocardioides ungokensis TaxID=1643322 RepID=UPI001FE390D8|nr:hypothetical protein [Nocardioides ungokensis]